MHRKLFPQVLFAASALLFAACSALQFTSGNPGLGLIFALIAAAGVTMFALIRSGRITW
ncbi:MAG: hypothetical protein ABI310_06020 [Microbacteriaceae bacterium]